MKYCRLLPLSHFYIIYIVHFQKVNKHISFICVYQHTQHWSAEGDGEEDEVDVTVDGSIRRLRANVCSQTPRTG